MQKRKPFKHVRQTARKHHADHQKLKTLLGRALHTEKVWDVFIGTFVVSISTIILFLNWGNIRSFFAADSNPEPAIEEELKPSGFQKGVIATYQINGQTADQYIRLIRNIPTNGFETGVNAVNVVGKKERELEENSKEALLNSIFLSTELSKGNHLSTFRDSGGQILQKSILTTFYLGEKTININSSIQTDSKLLSQINSTLSVDIFAYLNQSSSRADTLENYINLLETLKNKAVNRSAELQSQINFLNANFNAQNVSIGLTEEAFFNNLKIFDGEDAENDLARFIGLEKEQSEVRAKLGAYSGIKDYYDHFLPLIENLLTAIKANRDPLVAGVKVVEIQNMTLPLIIRGQ